jgi:lysophospholipase
MSGPALTPASLVEIPKAPAPEGSVAQWLPAEDGARLRVALFKPEGAARGSVVLSPGRTEPIEKYFEVVGELSARGFVVLVHDWRGQGLSARALQDRLFGHARGWRPFLADYDLILKTFADRLPKPWIAMGHSMGGGLTTLALAEGESRFAGAVLSAPMLGMNTGERTLSSVRRLSFLMNLVGRSKALVAPAPDPLKEHFAGNILTHDEARWNRTHAQIVAEPDLRLGGITWGWLAFALTLTQRVVASRKIDTLAIPLTIVAAEDDKLVINAAAKAVADRAPHGRYVDVPGAYHEVLMETDPRRAVFWTEFDAIADKVAPKVGVQKLKAEPKAKAAPKSKAPPNVEEAKAAVVKAPPKLKAAPKEKPPKAATEKADGKKVVSKKADPKTEPKPRRAPAKPKPD